MSEFRTIENRFTLPLDTDRLTVREGVNGLLADKLWSAHKREETDHYIKEVVAEIESMSPHAGVAVYSLGRGATLHAIATFSWEQSPVDQSQSRFNYLRYTKARGADAVDPDHELTFIKAIHEDLKDGLRPYYRRYEKPTWASVLFDDIAKRALYERAGYSHDGALSDEAIMIRRT